MEKNIIIALLAVTAACASVAAGCSGSSAGDDGPADELYVASPVLQVRHGHGKTLSIVNRFTDETILGDVDLVPAPFLDTGDSLAVFHSGPLSGFYNVHTGRADIPARFRRAWSFSEGLAAVRKDDGDIAFVDTKGRVVIDLGTPYEPGQEYAFRDGVCPLRVHGGKEGAVDRTGTWVIPPEYDQVRTYRDYVVVTAGDSRYQMAYDGTVLNTFLIDDVEPLWFSREAADGEGVPDVRYNSGFFAYQVGDRWGLMDPSGRRLTRPLYDSIWAVSGHLFKARPPETVYYILLDDKGEEVR